MTALVTSVAASNVVTVNGWAVELNDGEPRNRDVDLAERAGPKQPRDIRRAMEAVPRRTREFGRLDMRVHCARISNPRGGYEERRVTEFWLTEHRARPSCRTRPGQHHPHGEGLWPAPRPGAGRPLRAGPTPT